MSSNESLLGGISNDKRLRDTRSESVFERLCWFWIFGDVIVGWPIDVKIFGDWGLCWFCFWTTIFVHFIGRCYRIIIKIRIVVACHSRVGLLVWVSLRLGAWIWLVFVWELTDISFIVVYVGPIIRSVQRIERRIYYPWMIFA
jgi:hypothetical protein